MIDCSTSESYFYHILNFLRETDYGIYWKTRKVSKTPNQYDFKRVNYAVMDAYMEVKNIV